jgi:hypothetical protein
VGIVHQNLDDEEGVKRRNTMSPITVHELNKSLELIPSYPAGKFIQPFRKRRLYFVQAGSGEIKIGVTTHRKIKEKLRQIQTYCHQK